MNNLREIIVELLYKENVHADIAIEDLADAILESCKKNDVTGRWIPIICPSDGEHHEWCGYKCSECGKGPERLTRPKFCPNCGKPMISK